MRARDREGLEVAEGALAKAVEAVGEAVEEVPGVVAEEVPGEVAVEVREEGVEVLARPTGQEGGSGMAKRVEV